MSQISYQHVTVLLEEAIEALSIVETGTYIDGTFGRGGHSRAILDRLGQNGRLMMFDKDPEAVAEATKQQQLDGRCEIYPGSFIRIPEVVEENKLQGKINGILLDLGVSSPQLDDANRGFSFMKDGPLDMRMDSSTGIGVAQWLETASEKDIAKILKDYGEERYAKRIAKAIVAEQQKNPISRTAHLAEVIKLAHPNWERHKHPATRSFQALRIFINRELEELEVLLAKVIDLLDLGGRLVVISFHSLEDRIVKRFIQQQCSGDHFPAGLPVTDDQIQRRMKKINKRILPGKEEIGRNPRARSATMRVAEKIA